jgi:hypothetical protein
MVDDMTETQYVLGNTYVILFTFIIYNTQCLQYMYVCIMYRIMSELCAVA